MRKSVALVIAVVVVIAVLAALVYAYQANIPSEEVTKLIWQKMGGIAGLSEELVIEANGSALYHSDRFGDAKLILSSVEVEDFMDKANFFTIGREYAPKPDVADYFTYRLTLYTASGLKTVVWVDAWASEETLPKELGEVQLYFESIVRSIRQETSYEKAIKLAKDFIVQAPTFRFDGMPETLNVTGSVALESFPVQYVITITFNSRHAGYGDRTGQFLAQVITPHEAVVKVVSDNVVSAILDGKWDELRQEPIQENILPQQGIISGLVSIGPLCPVEPCPPQPDVYSSREIILKPQVGDTVLVRLSPDGSFEARVDAGTNTVDLINCICMGCNL